VNTLAESLGGLWALLVLAIKSRFRMGNAYWRWRSETAFGHKPGQQLSGWQRFRAVMEYGRWVYRMKRSIK
jgi:hypothetical protein